jgi:hypothetical protein
MWAVYKSVVVERLAKIKSEGATPYLLVDASDGLVAIPPTVFRLEHLTTLDLCVPCPLTPLSHRIPPYTTPNVNDLSSCFTLQVSCHLLAFSRAGCSVLFSIDFK